MLVLSRNTLDSKLWDTESFLYSGIWKVWLGKVDYGMLSGQMVKKTLKWELLFEKQAHWAPSQ